jgi:hypothetical protein
VTLGCHMLEFLGAMEETEAPRHGWEVPEHRAFEEGEGWRGRGNGVEMQWILGA